jgi:uncharacterized protein
MVELTADEARALGVLIEKAMTTPEGYPLSLNALVNGSNQKNNRHPVTNLEEMAVLTAVNGLKAKGFVVQVDVPGGRTSKYRHEAERKLGVGKASLALLAELMLRGPQTLGELRGRASRMQPFDSLEAVKGVLDPLMQREEPLVKQIAPAPGSRAERFLQLLAPEAHELEDGTDAGSADGVSGDEQVMPGAPSVRQRVEALEGEVAQLRAALQRLATALGEPDPLANGTAPVQEPEGSTPAT